MITCSSILAQKKFHGQSSLLGYWVCKELGATEAIAHTHMVCLHQVHSTSYKPEMYQQSLSNIINSLQLPQVLTGCDLKTEGFYSNTSRNTEPSFPANPWWNCPPQLWKSWCIPQAQHMSVRQQGNLTGLSFLLCNMAGLGQMASAVTDSVISKSPSQALDSTPK